MPLTLISKPTVRRKPVRDDNYCSWLGSERLYSLSRMLRDLDLKPDFGDTPEYVIRNAASRGKLTEEYCYRLLQQGPPIYVRDKHCGSLRQGVAERLEAFHRWTQKYEPEYVDSQDLVWNEQDRICWKRDLRVKISGRLWLIDIKCTSRPEKDWPLQIGCGLSYDEDGCTKGAILHLNPRLNKQGYRFIEYDGPRVTNWYRRAVHRWHSNRDFNLLRNELGFNSEAMGFETEDEDA